MEIRSFWLVFFLFLCSVNLTFGVNVELGTKVLVQPDGTKVTAREFVDESGRYLSTSNGFVVKDPKTGYYHYLQYDDVGGSSPSALRAGIDDQSPDMAQLRKKNEQGINARVQTASRSVEETPIPGEFDSLIVILVEFDDVTHDSRYTDGDFYSMLFGRNYARTPDGEEVYGSMYQYWSDMSCGTYEVRGRIANQIGENDSGDPIPEWIALGRDKGYFHGVDRTSFIGTALDSAVSQQGLDVSTSDRRKLCIIYAGNVYFSSDVGKGLVPAWNLGYRTYTMSEKWAAPHTGNSETDLAKFSHIGAHCHEYGHSLGLPDMYYKKPREGREPARQFVEYKEWGLMASGAGKATSASTWGDNPAPVTPHFRADLGWIQPSPVNSHGQRTLTYSSERQSYQSDVYRISSHGASKDFFLIENRQTGSGWNIGPVADDKDGLTDLACT